MDGLGPPVGHVPSAAERAERLVRLFHAPGDWGRVRDATGETLDDLSRQLLDHHRHMTVTIEEWIGGPVAVDVLGERSGQSAGGADNGRIYAREITLSGRVAGSTKLLQYGIVRIDLGTVPEPVARSIREGREPLGRLLIDAGVHRDIQDVGLVEVDAGQRLARACALPIGERLAGRVATIRLAREDVAATTAGEKQDVGGGSRRVRRSGPLVSAVELLEILIPLRS